MYFCLLGFFGLIGLILFSDNSELCIISRCNCIGSLIISLLYLLCFVQLLDRKHIIISMDIFIVLLVLFIIFFLEFFTDCVLVWFGLFSLGITCTINLFPLIAFTGRLLLTLDNLSYNRSLPVEISHAACRLKSVVIRRARRTNVIPLLQS